MIILTLTNTGEHHPTDYVSATFKFDDDDTWMDIVAKLMSQGLPALGYSLPTQPDILFDMLTDKVDF